MSNKPIGDKNREPSAAQEIDFSELVCSPEFPQGCIDPLEDVPVPVSSGNIVIKPSGPVAETDLDEVVCSLEYPDRCIDPREELEPIQFENVPEQPEVSFTEVVCSPEFPQGCVDPLEDEQ